MAKKKKKKKKKRGMPAALAAYWRDKRQPKRKRSKKKSKKSNPKKRSTHMAKKRKKRGGKSAGALLNRKNLVIAGTLLAAGYITKKAADGEAAAFRDMPVITPLGRWGTLAAVSAGLYAAGVARRTTAATTLALGGLALFTYGRRGGLYGDEQAVRADILGQSDDGAVYLEGNAEDVIDAAAHEAGVVG